MTRLTALILLALAGCNDQAFNAERAFDEAPAADGRLRIDVYAPTDLELTDDRGELLDLRPQTFFTMVEGEDSRVTLTVTPAVAVGGLVEGIALTPFPSADVPTVAGPLAGASVQFGQEDGVQQPRTVTFADGVYDVPIVPSELEYAVAVIPATPYVPIHRERVAVDGRTRSLDFFVDLGVPVWGEVTDTRGHIVDGHVAHWQVTLKIGFTLEDD